MGIALHRLGRGVGWLVAALVTATPVHADEHEADDAPYGFVRVGANEQMTLEQRESDGRWTSICTTPCHEPLGRSLVLRFRTRDGATSSTFALEDKVSDLEASTPSATQTIGMGLLAGGLIAGLAFAAGFGLHSASAGFLSRDEESRTWQSAAVVAGATGLSIALTGLVLVLAAPSVSVSQRTPQR